MLVIVEGTDGVGKTTLVERLARRASGIVTVMHRGPLERHPLVEYELDLETYRPGADRTIVCDRWHLGELVYGPALRGESRLDLAMRRHVELFLMVRGAVLVLLMEPAHVLIERLIGRGDDLIQPERSPELQDAYLEVTADALLPVILGRHDVVDDPDCVLELAIATERLVTKLAEFRSLIGNPVPRYLLLGERRGPSNPEGHHAAFAPYASTSGHYLLDALPPDILCQSAIANACEEDVGKLWERLGQPQVIALGREAQRRCREAELDHGAVPHPQFVRRFHHRAATEYVRMIRRAGLFQEDLTKWPR